MGKIFKALEKAEKKGSPKIVESTTPNREKFRLADDDSANTETVFLSTKNQVLTGPAPTSETFKSMEAPADRKPLLQKEISSSVSQFAMTAGNSLAKPVETTTSDKLERGGVASEIPGTSNLQVRPVKRDALSEQVIATGMEPSSVNLSLANKMQSDSRLSDAGVSGQPNIKGNVGTVEEATRARAKEHVNVRYSRTKIQFNDPEKLKNNKVVSIFDDIDTANQFKILRTQVLRKLTAVGGNSILITSANPFEGKTFTSVNLGISIAKEFDRTVLIIDADIRRPLKHHADFSTEFFSLEVKKGLTDYLMGYADIEHILINPGIDKITLIPGGVPVDNSPELLNSSRMEEMMTEIKSRYPSDRLIIVDGPALLPYPDASILYRYVDGVLPVVESEKTSTEDLKKMMKQLEDVNLLGVVMNKNRG